MMEYILKIKNISDNLATIGEPINEIDQILQLLGGLCPIYNSILASLTTREDNISFHSIHSILLTHEQRLCFQNTTSPETDIISANMATTHHQNNNNKRINTIANFSQIRTVLLKGPEDLLLHLVTIVQEATTTQLITILNANYAVNMAMITTQKVLFDSL